MCLIVVVKLTFRLDLMFVKGIEEESVSIYSQFVKVFVKSCSATKMNVFVHFVRGLLEPAVWQLLQWIWSLESS